MAGKKCVGMEGCIHKGAEALEEEGEDTIPDLSLIGAGSHVEHYEMAGYLTAISLAKRIGAAKVCELLQQSLAEEQTAEKSSGPPSNRDEFILWIRKKLKAPGIGDHADEFAPDGHIPIIDLRS